MKFLLTIVCLIMSAATVIAQNQRIELTTDSDKVVDLSSTTYNFGTYKDNTFKLGYNSDSNGNKIVNGEPDFAFRFEPRWLTSDGYNTEIYLEWTSANGAIAKKRPWGMNIVDSTGDVIGRMQGRWSFHDNAGNQTALWLSEGFLDFITAQGGIRFRNNTAAIKAYNAQLTGDLTLLKLDTANRVVLSPDGAGIVLGGPTSASTVYYTDTIYRGTPGNAVKIVGRACPAIGNSTGEFDNQRAINELLECLREHGLLAQ